MGVRKLLALEAKKYDTAAIMPRFVLLRHECPPQFEKPSHWDFMLEWGEVLRTWELRQLPTRWAEALGVLECADSVDAAPLADHRLAYLDFEGPLTNGRGSVRQCGAGTYEIHQDEPDELVVELQGNTFRGTAKLSRCGKHWRLADAE